MTRMSRIVGWSTALLVSALAIAYFALYLTIAPVPFEPYGFPGGVLIFTVTGSIFGALIVGRNPRNGVGWTLLAASLMLAITSDGQLYAVRSAYLVNGSLPLTWLAAWLG